jgi:hypothetical protein
MSKECVRAVVVVSRVSSVPTMSASLRNGIKRQRKEEGDAATAPPKPHAPAAPSRTAAANTKNGILCSQSFCLNLYS